MHLMLNLIAALDIYSSLTLSML